MSFDRGRVGLNLGDAKTPLFASALTDYTPTGLGLGSA
jgi:hypothetical protein